MSSVLYVLSKTPGSMPYNAHYKVFVDNPSENDDAQQKVVDVCEELLRHEGRAESVFFSGFIPIPSGTPSLDTTRFCAFDIHEEVDCFGGLTFHVNAYALVAGDVNPPLRRVFAARCFFLPNTARDKLTEE